MRDGRRKAVAAVIAVASLAILIASSAMAMGWDVPPGASDVALEVSAQQNGEGKEGIPQEGQGKTPQGSAKGLSKNEPAGSEMVEADDRDAQAPTSESGNASTHALPSESSPEGADDVGASDSKIRISLIIDASSVQGEGWPSSMGSFTLELSTGSTVMDALRATGIAFTGSSSYVSSIDGLYAGMYGASSGWMYSVDGVTPMRAANAYGITDGNAIRWYYSR